MVMNYSIVYKLKFKVFIVVLTAQWQYYDHPENLKII